MNPSIVVQQNPKNEEENNKVHEKPTKEKREC